MAYVSLWNPSIRQAKKLLRLSFPHHDNGCTVYGFGLVPFSDTYKVVAIYCYDYNYRDDSSKSQVKVLTLGTNSWRTIQEFPAVDPRRYNHGKFVSGSLNWLIRKRNSYVIVSLDLRTESYGEVLQPDYGEEEEVGMCSLLVFRNCLCILSHTAPFSMFGL